ncbi:MAG: hypothetical protein M3Z18_00410 [Gemmatimonadota bacterium]|nr:hypothetical protein [Gemmatimonadota bacterium]
MPALKLRRFVRYRWPLIITMVVAVTAAFSLSPLIDVVQPRSPSAASLGTSVPYDILAPVSNILDTLTLLTPAQYWGTFALCALLFFAPGIVRDLRRRSFSIQHTIASSLRFVGGTVAVVGIVLMARRPMAALTINDPELIAVDFHSHTSASHDGRAGFDSERNREWHQSAGFNAAYITDHRTLEGALDAMERNPVTAGAGMALLAGVELRDGDQHPILLGVDPKRTRITSPDLRDSPVRGDGRSVEPILLFTIPGNIASVPRNELGGPVRLAGIEISDGSPRGMAQTARDKDKIMALADRLRLAPIAGSDNHGWGRTAPAWSVLRIPGWRDMTPTGLDVAIRRTILARVSGTTEVIARRTAGPPSGRVEAALGGFAVASMMFRTMNWRERVSWIMWSWAGALISLMRARRNRRQLRILVRESMRKRVSRPLGEVAAAMQTAL